LSANVDIDQGRDVKSVPLERRGDYIVKMYELEEDVCRQMLARCSFGRVAFGDDEAGLTILPVNCVCSDDAVLFRAQAGSALDRLGAGRVVAFEADQIDPIAESGWSVLVRGTATHLTDRQRIDALAQAAVHPWAPGRRDRWIEIHPQQITGRIIRRYRQIGDAAPVSSMPPD
jgi:nitroimidazol reductase NimA-like FMN-containing flavoprotein (pyridoxamine 5'-phosphate oxidase superfamily)